MASLLAAIVFASRDASYAFLMRLLHHPLLLALCVIHCCRVLQIPLPTGSCAYVFAAHFLEHLSFYSPATADALLREVAATSPITPAH